MRALTSQLYSCQSIFLLEVRRLFLDLITSRSRDLPALLIDQDVPSRRWKLTTGLTAQMQLEELTDHDMRVVWTCTHPEHVFEAGVHVATAQGLGTFLDMRRGRW